jgi:hypothetical protein
MAMGRGCCESLRAETSFITEGDDGVDARGEAGRDVTRCESYGDQQNGAKREDRGIGGADVDQQSGKHRAKGEIEPMPEGVGLLDAHWFGGEVPAVSLGIQLREMGSQGVSGCLQS